MGDELAHFSVLDDESSISYFLNWAGGFGGGSKLRGGDRVASGTSSDAHIDIEHASAGCHAGVVPKTVPPTDHNIRMVGSKTPQRDHIQGTTLTPVPTPAVTPQHAHTLSKNFPTPPTTNQDSQPANSRTPGDTNVISVAHRRSAYTSIYPGPKSAAVNTLEEVPVASMSTAPVQQELVERVSHIDQKAPPTRPVPLSTQSEAATCGLKPTESADHTAFDHANTAPVLRVKEDTRSGDRHNTTGVFDRLKRQFFSPEASTECNLAADAFRHQMEDHVENKTSHDVLPTKGADLPSDNETTGVKPEGSMDLAPVLEALGARSTVPSIIKATPPEVSTNDTKHARSIPTKAIGDDVIYRQADELAAAGSEIPALLSKQCDYKTTSSLAATPTEEVEVFKKTQSKSRTVILKNLPENADYNMVQSLIYGAVIESMKLFSEKNTAIVKVTDVEDCQRYLDSCPTGIKVKVNRVQQTVLVEKLTEADTVDDKLQAYLDCGVTRVVKVEDANEEMTMKALYKFAEGHSDPREIESIVDSCRKGIRSIVFRFTSVYDAVAFRSALLRDRDWKSKNPHFAGDPCEHATSPHIE